MNKTEVYLDPVSGLLQMVCSPVDPSTEKKLVTDIIIREIPLYGEYARSLLIKKPKNNFHAGTRNGVPTRRK